MKRLVLSLGLAALAVATAACSGGSTASPTASAPAGDAIVVVARDLKFLTASVTAPADEAFQIVLDNQDSAPHNIAIKDASGAQRFKGDIVSSKQITNAVPALAAGAYEFWCEVHPDMKGALIAS